MISRKKSALEYYRRNKAVIEKRMRESYFDSTKAAYGAVLANIHQKIALLTGGGK